MLKYIKLFETHEPEYIDYMNSLSKILPNLCYCEDADDVHLNYKKNYSDEYLTFTALEDGTITFNIWKNMGTDLIEYISYSFNGIKWITFQNQDNKEENLTINVDISKGDKILWKGKAQ